MTWLIPYVVGGLLGSTHCLGMCGGFPLALAAGKSPRRSRQVLYNLGRLNTLIFVGAVAGGFGALLVTQGPALWMERLLAVVGGAIMLIFGAEQLGVFAIVTPRLAALLHAHLGGLMRSIVTSRSPLAPLVFGILNELLPCHLIYAFAAQAAVSGSAVGGILVMAAFGLGTVPAMLGLGLVPATLSPRLRQRLFRLSGYLVLLLGALTMARACGSPAHTHHH